MTEDEISYKVRGVVFDIYNNLGIGLYESVYEEVMYYELTKIGLNIKRQVEIPLIWKDVKLDKGFRADLIIENKVIIEIKSVETLLNIHFKQLSNYVKLTNLKLGILINFNENDITKGIKRYVNNL